MPIDALYYPDETRLMRLAVAAAAWEKDELTRKVDLLEDLVEFHREESAQLRSRLRRAEEALADQEAPMPVEDSGVEGLERVAA